MRKLLEFQILDCNAEYYGINLSELMDNAGLCVADYISNNYTLDQSISIVCGKGNNGGDGYVASLILIEKGFDVEIFQTELPKSNIVLEKYNRVKDKVKEIKELKRFKKKTDILVDCLLGSGIIGNPRPPYDDYINTMNNFDLIISVDVPSGIATNCPIIPDATITFHDYKLEMNKENSGIIILCDIGFPKDIDLRTGPGELFLYPKFTSNKHKGENGKVAIIGGGPYSGAPALSALGAYRTGVDLVHVFVPEISYEQVSSFIPELIVHKLSGDFICDEHTTYLLDKLREFDSIVIGPGIGKKKSTRHTIQKILDNIDNLVLDADAIFDYSFNNKSVLLTPHEGELKRLVKSNNKESLIHYSSRNNVTILVKGAVDIITDGSSIKENSTGHPRMAVGGTGDVLSGVCGALMGRGLSPFEAARLASYSLGKAGELCYDKIGSGFLATDLAKTLSKILQN